MSKKLKRLTNKLITTDKNYSYKLTVTGSTNKKDTTREKDIKVTEYDPLSIDIELEKTDQEKQTKHKDWLRQQSKINNLEKQTIPIRGETIKIIGEQLSPKKINVKKR